MADDSQDSRTVVAAILLFGLVALLVAWDLLIDYRKGASQVHIAIELLVLLIATLGMAFLFYQLRQTRSHLAVALVEAEQWRSESRELMKGLGVAIEKQFARWELSRAEAEVGLMLLKGLSHKDIARLRNTSERTSREQARALYRKAGLSGRSELSSFFLEDLLLPRESP